MGGKNVLNIIHALQRHFFRGQLRIGTVLCSIINPGSGIVVNKPVDQLICSLGFFTDLALYLCGLLICFPGNDQRTDGQNGNDDLEKNIGACAAGEMQEIDPVDCSQDEQDHTDYPECRGGRFQVIIFLRFFFINARRTHIGGSLHKVIHV